MKTINAKAKPAGRALAVAPAFHSVIEAEVISGLSRWTWRRWAYRGQVASVKVGPRLLIPKSEIDRVMAAGLRPASQELVNA